MKPSFFAAWRHLGLAAALARGGAPSDTAFKAAEAAKTYAEAIPVYKKLAAQGHPGAQHELAVVYDFGHDVKVDHGRAARLYALAAAAGHAEAQFNLGMSFCTGEGVPVDMAKATELFEKAAAQDHPKALNMLGVMYRDGGAGATDEVKAVACFRRASALGNPAGDLNLGVSLLEREEDAAEAEQCLERAAAAEVEGAAEALVDLRLKSKDAGVVTAAVKALQEDAGKNRFGAMARLGLELADGECLPRDLVQSFAWMCGALAVFVEVPNEGKSELINKLDVIKAEMTEEQIDAGREQVIERYGVNAGLILAHIYKDRLFDNPDIEESDAWIEKAIEHGADTRRYVGYRIFTDVGG